eukprot:GHVH01007253.1.p1 GENE.GHVH01007253.1~~GHVH01007253.1.p1  ORF type:complete len:805 (+),score=84.03 GHVH01007253.1:307-2415(+)
MATVPNTPPNLEVKIDDRNTLATILKKSADVEEKEINYQIGLYRMKADFTESTSHLLKIDRLRDVFLCDYPRFLSGGITSHCTSERRNTDMDIYESREPSWHPQNVVIPKNLNGTIRWRNGVLQVLWKVKYDGDIPAHVPQHEFIIHRGYVGDGDKSINLSAMIPSARFYAAALSDTMTVASHPAAKQFAYERIQYLLQKFNKHQMFSSQIELDQCKLTHHRDFYNVRKIDNHIHHSACMHQKHLLRFINTKFMAEKDTIVTEMEGRGVSLKEMFQRLGLHPWETTCDNLNVSATGDCFHRFDLFNDKYNPYSAPELRGIFLKTNNHIDGRFLAELTREVIDQLEDHKYQHVEWRVSIYGTSQDEWLKLSNWVNKNELWSKNVRWVVQVPRIYNVVRKKGQVKSFEELLRNIFEPVCEAVMRPEANKEIFKFLLQVVGWDTVDDESKKAKKSDTHIPPHRWTSAVNPPYSYWLYYLYANIKVINNLLCVRGMNTKPFRPHCGEAGNLSHLGAAFLVADKINHGINLKFLPALQYLYYKRQIPIAMSPLSNNALFKEIKDNPFNRFFRMGLHVTVSTDDPLMLHFTSEPLMEEYSLVGHTWKLNTTDLCEVARNSVLHCDFEPQFKEHWLGTCACSYKMKESSDQQEGTFIDSSNVATNVAPLRLAYREKTLAEEIYLLENVSGISQEQTQEDINELLLHCTE